MNAEFFSAIEDLEKEKGIPREYMYDKIKQAMLAAFRRDNPECADNVDILLDEDRKRIEMYVNKVAVEQVEDPALEIDLEAAKKVTKRAKLGDTIKIPVETKKFGRIAAQAAKQVIIQGIREAERGIVYEEFTSKEHEILTGVVSRIEPRTGSDSIRISSNSEYTEAMLSPNERIKTEPLKEGDRIKVYVGLSPDGRLVEMVENPACRWFVAAQFHPEFKSRPNKPHPLFNGFVKAALE